MRSRASGRVGEGVFLPTHFMLGSTSRLDRGYGTYLHLDFGDELGVVVVLDALGACLLDPLAAARVQLVQHTHRVRPVHEFMGQGHTSGSHIEVTRSVHSWGSNLLIQSIDAMSRACKQDETIRRKMLPCRNTAGRHLYGELDDRLQRGRHRKCGLAQQQKPGMCS